MKIFIIAAIVIFAVLGIILLFVVRGGGGIKIQQDKNSAATPSEDRGNVAYSDVLAYSETIQNKEKVFVSLKTEKGDMGLELYPKVAPKTVANFVLLAKNGFYNGIKFHRVVADFVIQGGDPLSKMNDSRVGSGGPGYSFEDEINPKSLGLDDNEISVLESQGYQYDYLLESMKVNVGVIAMANSGPNTNGSQFFIVTTSDQPHLNGKHTVFGKVVEGMDVALEIEQGDMIEAILISE